MKITKFFQAFGKAKFRKRKKHAR